jgi:CRISPR-associated protein Cas2
LGQKLSDPVLSEFYRVWLFAFFDLPVNTEEGRRDYTRFRKALLNDGFLMVQFSVYARYCSSEEAATWHRRRARAVVPPKGEVRLLHVTDKQFAKMEVYRGSKREQPEEPPRQFVLF